MRWTPPIQNAQQKTGSDVQLKAVWSTTTTWAAVALPVAKHLLGALNFTVYILRTWRSNDRSKSGDTTTLRHMEKCARKSSARLKLRTMPSTEGNTPISELCSTARLTHRTELHRPRGQTFKHLGVLTELLPASRRLGGTDMN